MIFEIAETIGGSWYLKKYDKVVLSNVSMDEVLGYLKCFNEVLE